MTRSARPPRFLPSFCACSGVLGAFLLAPALWAPPAAARIGFGDPGQVVRDKKPDETLDFHATLRMRSALFNNLDLDRGISPSSGQPLWPDGEGDLDTTAGSDLRLRLAPNFFLGDDARILVELDILDGVALGASPRGAPFNGQAAIVSGTAFQDPLTFANGAFRVRTAVGEVLTPFGVLSAGRMPSHFGLGIAANAGDDLDDDGGDRSDRIGFVMPLLGHIVATGYDWAATGPVGKTVGNAPDPQDITGSEQAFSVAILKFRAPWEVELYRQAGQSVFDYAVGLSTEWQNNDYPNFYQSLSSTFGTPPAERVRRDYSAVAADVWARLIFGNWRLEGEAFASSFTINNASPYPGVTFRQPITGTPYGGVLVAEWADVKKDPDYGAAGSFRVLVEGGLASADSGFGFPLNGPSSFLGQQAGDVTGPQFDGGKDRRIDAFRFNSAYRIDLILWRTLLGGVSEAAYGRVRLAGEPARDLTLELNGVYSHALDAASTPGGVAPLGAEVDAAATLRIGDHFSLRLDGGLLVPLGGLGQRGGSAPGLAHMLLVRLAYAR